MKMLTAYREFLVAPVFAALAFTIPNSFRLMHRADSIYIPFLFEIPMFVMSYMAFATVSLLCFGPLSKVALARGTDCRTGAIFAIAASVIGTCLLCALEIFGNNSIFHRSYIFGSFIPLLVLSIALFYYGKRKIERIRGFYF